MTERVSIHCTPNELAARLDVEPPPSSTCLPSYNLSPPGALMVVRHVRDEREVRRIPWRDPGSKRLSIAIGDVRSELSSDHVRPVLLPLSGFYLWKSVGDRADHPFYIRPQRESFLLAGGLLYLDKKGDPQGVLPIHQPANALIRPLDTEMIWSIPEEKSDAWVEGEWLPDPTDRRTYPGLGITEWTVHRVGPAVNEMSRDGEELIQPLPK